MHLSMSDVVFRRMVISVVVSKVVTAFIQVDSDLALGFAIFEPVYSHVD